MENNKFSEIVEGANRFTDEWNKKAGEENVWRGTNPYYITWYNQQRLAASELLNTVYKSLKGKKVLDFGCGDGFEFYLFRNLGAELSDLTGIEINKNLVEKAKSINPNYNISTYDGITIPFPDESFDLCVNFVVFSSIPDKELRKHLASEIRRVLKPGGYIYWFDLNRPVYGDTKEFISPAGLWPGMKISTRNIAPVPPPSLGLRPLKGLKKLLTPLFDMLGYKATHLSALIGPK